MKKMLLSIAMMGVMGQSVAQELPQRFAQLPDLPPASSLQNSYVGNHYLLGDGLDKDPVVFVGFNLSGQALAYSLTDVPEYKVTQQDAIQMCAAKGQGWKLPAIDEIMLLTPHVDDAVIGYLPGNHWTTTNAPCEERCSHRDKFFVTYDPLSGNQGNSYNFAPLLKSYPSCVYTF